MLLKIIDNASQESNETGIGIIFESGDSLSGAVKGEIYRECFMVNSYTSPVTTNFRQALAHYFNGYLTGDSSGTKPSIVAEKIVKLGQYIGDELLGEDHQLLKITEIIEAYGYENLQVQIESSRTEFFKELWEIAILPESKYILSSVVRGYVRQFVQKNFPNDYAELHYALKVSPPSKEKLTQFMAGDSTGVSKSSRQDHQPLRILYLASRPETMGLPYTASHSIIPALEALAVGGAIEYDICHLIQWEQLKDKLEDKRRPIHILHYDGPVIVEDEVPNFVIHDSGNANSVIPFNKLIKLMPENRVGVLSLDARIYFWNGQPLPASEGLAIVAQSAHQCGLGNVIGLAQITNPWISSHCFSAIYSQIVKGFDLAQAIVEARKQLQSETETDFMSVKSRPFQPWPLLVHYSKQSVTFFHSAQIIPDESSQEFYQEKLFGFRSEMLPPLLHQVSDGQALSIVDHWRRSKLQKADCVISITGDPGTGKSQLAHLACAYLVQAETVDFGFYFSFGNDNYSSTDMLQMIAPVLNLSIDQVVQTEQKLAQLSCCFVLDNLADNESAANLMPFVKKLISSGHMIIAIAESSSTFHSLATCRLITKPLDCYEQQILAADVVRRLNLPEERIAAINDTACWNELLKSLNGNPWLINKVLLLLSSHTPQDLLEKVETYINGKEENSIVFRFYEWRWSELDPVWQRLLILCSQTKGLLLEMLMVANNQKENVTSDLFSLLGNSGAQFSDGFEQWISSGFLNRLSHGHLVDTRCQDFLFSHYDDCFKDINQQRAHFFFSQFLCEGIRLLAQHLSSKPNPVIANYLLFNRHLWVEHFERLWYGQDYSGFMAVKQAFDRLLHQVNLLEDSKAWILQLLKQSPLILPNENSTKEGKLSWLGLASGVITFGDAAKSLCMERAAEEWGVWFKNVDEPTDKEEVVLLHTAAAFLEGFYQSRSEWNECIAVCTKTYHVYTRFSAWHGVIQSLKSLANYNHRLGHEDEALQHENRIIADIPYDGSPPGFRAQQMLEIALARLSRNEAQHAQVVLDQLRITKDAEKLSDLLDSVQCDIHYQEKNYLAALPFYCKSWVTALQAGHQTQIANLHPRLIELEHILGDRDFNHYFDRAVPPGTVKPADYQHPVSSLSD